MRAHPRAKPPRWSLSALPALLLATALAHAEAGRMTVVVQAPTHEPLANVSIGIAGDGSIELTDVGGRARLRLAPKTPAGSHVRLQVVPPPRMFFVSPFEGDAIVPSFENESGNFLAVILIRSGDAAALSNGVTLSKMIRQSQRQVNEAVPAKAPPLKKKLLYRLAYGPGSKEAPAPPGRTPAVGPAGQLPLITVEVAKRLGFTPEEVAGALKGWELESLAWKLVMTTALFEFGEQDPFSASFVDPAGVHFGLGGWSMKSKLREVWRGFREADPARFDAIMGADAQEVAAWLAGKAEPGKSLSMLEAPKEPSFGGRVAEPWKLRFDQLGGWTPYQRLQVEQMRPALAAAEQRARSIGLRSERAAAFFYDLIVQAGNGPGLTRLLDEFALDAKAFQQRLKRAPDEQESLLLLTNRWMLRFEKSPYGKVLRLRREVFALGQGSVGALTVSLEDAGIRLRDVDTGAEIPLSGDRATLERLKGGWLPEASVAGLPA